MTDFVEGESVSFERNENYWGEPDYKNVKIKVVLEESTRALAFSAGEVDAAILNFADNAVTFEGRESEGIRVKHHYRKPPVLPFHRGLPGGDSRRDGAQSNRPCR
jgi:ABC-type transport system substrate-binding protein